MEHPDALLIYLTGLVSRSDKHHGLVQKMNTRLRTLKDDDTEQVRLVRTKEKDKT